NVFFFSSRRRHTRSKRDWSSDVCSSDLYVSAAGKRIERVGSRKGDTFKFTDGSWIRLHQTGDCHRRNPQKRRSAKAAAGQMAGSSDTASAYGKHNQRRTDRGNRK